MVGSWIEAGPAGNGNTQEAGAVYLFRRSGSTWHESQRIPSPLNHFSDEFVQVDGDSSADEGSFYNQS